MTSIVFAPLSLFNSMNVAFFRGYPQLLITDLPRRYLIISHCLWVYYSVHNDSLAAICWVRAGPEVIKLFSCSTQLSMKFSLLINVKMPTIVGILTCMSGKNNILGLTEP